MTTEIVSTRLERALASVIVASMVASIAACGGRPASETPPSTAGEAPSVEAAPGASAWHDMDRNQRIAYMKTVVLPKMKDEFVKFDAKHFSDMNCGTCHGRGAKEGSFKMPNPDLPRLSVEDGFEKHMQEEPAITKFMMETVVPNMAALVDEPLFDPKTQKGFGCFQCHMQAASTAPPAAPAMLIKGMSTPESVLYDTEADVYLVSNIEGSPIAKDDNGFIAKLAPDGNVIDLKWIDGKKPNVTLNAPKGMAIAAGILYVADIDEVRTFDAKTGAPRASIRVKGASFLNDVATSPDGKVYVSDSAIKPTANGFDATGNDAIYEISQNNAKVLIRGTDLNGPNGLLADASGLWAVTFRSNQLYRVEGGKKISVTELPKGALDGILKMPDGSFVISSWETHQIFQGSPGQAFKAIFSAMKSPADLGYDTKRNRLLVPHFTENVVRVQPL